MPRSAGNAAAGTSDREGLRPASAVRDIRDLFSFGLWRAVVANDRIANRLIRDRYGLALPEWRVLGVVVATAPARFGTMLEYLRMDKGQASRLIKDLSARGLVTSEPDPEDQRRITLSPTAAGVELHDRVLAFAAERNDLTMKFLHEEDARTLTRIIGRLTPAIERSLAELESGG